MLTIVLGWWRLVCFNIEAIMTNSYIIYSDIAGVPKPTQKEFRSQVVIGSMIDSTGPGTMPEITTQAGDSDQPATGSTLGRGLNAKQSTTVPPNRKCASGCRHLLAHLEKKATCWYCRYKHRGEVPRRMYPALPGHVKHASSRFA